MRRCGNGRFLISYEVDKASGQWLALSEMKKERTTNEMAQLYRFFQQNFFNPNTLEGALVYLALFLSVALLIARIVKALFTGALKHDTHDLIDRTAATFFVQLSRVVIYVVALVLYTHLIPALHTMGTALLTGASVSAIVIGLAAQNTLGNFVAGLSLLLYRPLEVGDKVQITAPTGLETGTVRSVTLGYTILQTMDNRHVVVPNSLMANQVTVNLTRVNPRVMAIVPMGIGYSADIDKARQIMMETAQAHPLVQEVDSCPVTDLGESTVTLSLRAWCATPEDKSTVTYALYEQIKKNFDSAGIEIPYPYRNVVLMPTTNGPKQAQPEALS